MLDIIVAADRQIPAMLRHEQPKYENNAFIMAS